MIRGSAMERAWPPAPLPAGATAMFADNGIEVVVTRLDLGVEAIRESAALLSDAVRGRAARFTLLRDRGRFVLQLERGHLGINGGALRLDLRVLR